MSNAPPYSDHALLTPRKITAIKRRPLDVVVITRWLTDRGVVSNIARARQVRNIGRIDLKGLYTAILLFDANIQRAAYRAVQILNIKWPRRNGGLIDNTPLLTDSDLRIAARDAMYFGRVALQIRRQHAFVAGEVRPGETYRIKT